MCLHSNDTQKTYQVKRKARKKECHDSTLSDKTFQRCWWVCSVLTISCRACSLALRMAWFASEVPLKNTKFSLASGYQLEIDGFWVRNRACAHFPFRFRIPFVLCVCCLNLCESIYPLIWLVQSTLVYSYSSSLRIFLICLAQRALRRRNLMEISCLGLSVPRTPIIYTKTKTKQTKHKVFF